MNAAVAATLLDDACTLLRTANWQEGIAVAPKAGVRSVRNALSAKLTWIGREPGSGARRCLDRLPGNRTAPRRIASNHRSVADAVRSGWADAGICVQLASAEAGLDFFPVQREAYDVCFLQSMADDRRIKAFLAVIRSMTYRRLLDDLPGYDTSESGVLCEVR